MHVLKPSNDLIHEELYVFIADLFGGADHCSQIARHQRLQEITFVNAK